MTRSTRPIPRFPVPPRGVVAVGIAALIAVGLAGPAAGAVPSAVKPDASPRSAPKPVASQSLALILRAHTARTEPSTRAHRIESVGPHRPLTGVRTILPVIGRATDGRGTAWLHVRLPGRPSGHTGWILAAHTSHRSTEWYISVKLSARLVTVYHHGHVLRRFHAIVGKPSTPTPQGRFFVEEAMALAPSAAGGPFALATSARSHVLQEFDGGPGQIAVHGTNNLPGALGTAVSHGCIRLGDQAIAWLAERIRGGVPLTVSR
jgi:lipoprotein-anchoring transpeptidase ErfK/SrfK